MGRIASRAAAAAALMLLVVWEKYDETHSVIRFATSWATTMEDTQKLIQILEKNK